MNIYRYYKNIISCNIIRWVDFHNFYLKVDHFIFCCGQIEKSDYRNNAVKRKKNKTEKMNILLQSVQGSIDFFY